MAIKILCFFFLCHILTVAVVDSQGTSSVSFTTYQRVKSRDELDRLLVAMRGYTGATGGRKIDTEYLKNLRPDPYGIYQVPVAHYEYTVHHPPTPKRFLHSTPTKITINANGHFQRDAEKEKPCTKPRIEAVKPSQEPVTEDDEKEEDIFIFDESTDSSTLQYEQIQTTFSDDEADNLVKNVKNLVDLQNYALTSTQSKEKCAQGQAFIRGKCRRLYGK